MLFLSTATGGSVHSGFVVLLSRKYFLVFMQKHSTQVSCKLYFLLNKFHSKSYRSSRAWARKSISAYVKKHLKLPRMCKCLWMN